MKCSKCKEKAVMASEKAYCRQHFIDYFESKVISTINEFNLIKKGDRIIVGSSGGKDSTALLHIIKKYYSNVEALAIDEGIPGYRNLTLDDLKKFCENNKIPLNIYTYKEEFGFTLKEALKVRSDLKPCNICGALRRYILNSKARGFTKIATGHNLDDEAQSIMMNLIKSQTQIMSRLGPITGNAQDSKFVPRIKPLYFCTEKEVATYAIINKLGVRFSQCPHSAKSFRASVRDALNEHEQKNKGSKQAIVRNFLGLLPKLKQDKKPLKVNHCSNCGEPCSSNSKQCKACTIVESILPAAKLK